MPPRKPTRAPPFNEKSLLEAAIRYVERFQTTQARLVRHLRQKIRTRGWADDAEPDLTRIAARLQELGYVNDRLFAESTARGMTRRGLGAARVRQSLAASGVAPMIADEVLSDAVQADAGADAWDVALAFARRRRLGPFAREPADERTRARHMAAMLRAGHAPGVARRILAAEDAEAAEALADMMR